MSSTAGLKQQVEPAMSEPGDTMSERDPAHQSDAISISQVSLSKDVMAPKATMPSALGGLNSSNFM